jgi:hypothetical protein
VKAAMKLFGKKFDLVFLVGVVVFAVLGQGPQKLLAPFWDYSSYSAALMRFNQGGDPYGVPASEFPLVYPPIFLNLLAKVPFLTVYLLFTLATLAYVVYSVRKSNFVWPATVGFLAGGAGVGALLTANFAIFSHLLIVALLYSASRSERRAVLGYAVTALVIVLFASIKIYFAAYALVFLFLPNGIRYFFAIPICVACVDAAQMLLEPQLWAAFETRLRWQVITQHDSGLVLSGILQQRVESLSAIEDVLIHEAIVVALFLYGINPLREPRTLAFNDVSGKLFYVIAFAIIVNPRLKEYDIGALFACCYISLFQSTRPEDRAQRVIAYVVPVAFAAAWFMSRLTHVFLFLDLTWILSVYGLFLAISMRQRALRKVGHRSPPPHIGISQA